MRIVALSSISFLGLGIMAMAGDEPSAKSTKNPVVIPEPAPVASPLYHWFVGGTFGYLDDYDTEFYSAHIGVDMPYQIAGWDPAVYLEIAYFEPDYNLPTLTFGSVAIGGPTDVEIIPITLNYKLERELSAAVRAYLGLGAGVALVDISSATASDDSTEFYGQVFGGLLYQASETFELFGGFRWIYLDEIDLLGVVTLPDSGDDFLVEGGLRINF